MNYARQRWLPMIAFCLGAAAPAWAQPTVFPDDPNADGESRFAISDETGSVRLGQSASGSVTQVQAQFVMPPMGGPSPLHPDRVLGPTAPMFPDAMVPEEGSVGFASMNASKQILWRAGRVNMDQYGYEGGYSQFNAFVPLFGSPNDVLTWVNPRIGVTDYGMAAANLGGGIRKYDAGRDRVWGASAWWDYDNANSQSFNQIGGSFESIGNYYSLRGNFSIPTGNTTSFSSFSDGAVEQAGNNISLLRTSFFKTALRSFDLEFAFPLPVIGQYGFDAGLGVYNLSSADTTDYTGGSVRLQSQITENFWMNGIYTYDDLFRSMFSLNFEWTMSSGAPRKFFRRAPVQSYMTQSVIRRYRIPTGETSSTSRVLGEDANGVTVTIAYIDPTRTTNGDGTFENPYNSTAAYAADPNRNRYQNIFVYQETAGDAASLARLSTGITLFDGPAGSYNGQRLLGDVTGQATNINAWFGSVNTVTTLQSHATGAVGNRPTLSNAGAAGTNVVTLSGNGNEVAGFNINATNTASGIVGSAPMNGFYIHDNNFSNVINGVVITSNTATAVGHSLDGIGVIEDNTFTGVPATSNRAIQVTHTGGTLQLGVNGNTISDFAAGPNSAGIFINSTGGSTINGTGTATASTGSVHTDFTPASFALGIGQNTVTDSFDGIILSAMGASTMTLNVDGNTATGSLDVNGAGILALATSGSTINFSNFSNNTTTDGDGSGTIFRATGNSAINVTSVMLNNAFSDNGVDGLQVQSNDSAITIAGIGDNTAVSTYNNNGRYGMNLDALNTGSITISAPLANSQFNENGVDGLRISANAAMISLAGIGGTGGVTTFNNNDGNGMNVISTGGSTVTVGNMANPVINSQFNDNGDNGLLANVTGAGNTVTLFIGDVNNTVGLGNEFNGNGLISGTGSGLNLNVTNNAVLNTNVFNTTASNNAVDGLRYIADNTTMANVLTVNGGTFDTNGEHGIHIETTNITGSVAGIVVDGNSATGNMNGDSIYVNVDNVDAVADIAVINNNVADTVAGNGVRVNVSNVVGDVTGAIMVSGNTVDNSSLGGVLVTADTIGGNLNAINVDDNNVTNSLGGNGVTLTTTNVTGAVTTMSASGNTIDNSSLVGLLVNPLNITGGITNLNLDNNTVSNSLGGDGILAELNALTIGTMTVDGSHSTDNAGHGLNVNLTNATNITSLSISGTSPVTGPGYSNNDLNGIQISAAGLSNIGDMVIANNLVDGNQNHGVNIDITGDSTIPTITLSGNTITDQVTGNGVNLVNPDNGGAAIALNLFGNTISGQVAGHGVNVQLDGNAGLVTTTGYGNTISSNGGMGYKLTAINAATYNILMGDSAQAANLFDLNHDAGIGIDAANTTVGTVTVLNTTVSGTINGTDPNFNGEGLMAYLHDDAQLTMNVGDATLNNTFFTGNASDGIGALLMNHNLLSGYVQHTNSSGNGRDGLRVDVRGNNSGVFSQITSFNVTDSTFNTNTGSGVHFLRTSDGEIHDVSILRNTMNLNTENGISILAANANKTDNYEIDDNTITNNLLDGVLFNEQADALILANMDSNTITGNRQNGIHLIEQVNASSDGRSLSGTWTRNTISSNGIGGNIAFGQNGIYLQGATTNLMIGDNTDPTLGNTIYSNAGSGIRVSGAGDLTIGSNDIRYNGTLSELGTVNEDAGIYMDVAPLSIITVTNNFISQNNGDGIQYGIQTGFNGFQSFVTMTDNIVSSNAGRGIDLINRGNNRTYATITDNTVNSNLLEGVYIVNTASTTQNQFASSTTAMAADGSVFADGNLILQFNGNEVRANGQNSALSATGLVIRAGTNDGGNGTGDNGGFASTGGFTTDPTTAGISRGGIIASVYDNAFGGNFGNDILFASFVSTVDPATSAGTWSATPNPTVITTYQSDPLARFDLYFQNNTYDAGSADVNNGAGIANGTASQVAYYNNAEGTFKSRTSNLTPGGPFTQATGATRRRNAQRQAAAIQAPGTTFLYSGTGASTFRVNTTDASFIIDDVGPPWAGITFGNATVDEIPYAYSWGTLP